MEHSRSGGATTIVTAFLLVLSVFTLNHNDTPAEAPPVYSPRGAAAVRVPVSFVGMPMGRPIEQESGRGIASPPPTYARAEVGSAVDDNERFRRVWYPWEYTRVNTTAVRSSPQVWVTCAYNNGRSGHGLKDVATPYILAVWFGWTPCSQTWWSSKSVGLFNAAAGLARCPVSRSGKLESENSIQGPGVRTVKVIRFQQTTYDGLDEVGVRALREAVDTALASASADEDVLLYLTKSTRVHLDQAYTWAHKKPADLPVTVFTDVRRTLQARLFARLWNTTVAAAESTPQELPELSYLKGITSVNCSNMADRCELIRGSAATNLKKPARPAGRSSAMTSNGSTIVVAIHLRRGDLGAGMAEGEWTSKAFAQRLVGKLHKSLDNCAGSLEIFIYTEKAGANDLRQEPSIVGVTKIWSGGT